MTDEEANALFQKFAAPLFRHATTGDRQETAEKLARNLWLAMVVGPEIEQRLWEGLKDTMQLDAEGVALIRQCYAQEMRPLISEEQRAALQQRYKVQPKG